MIFSGIHSIILAHIKWAQNIGSRKKLRRNYFQLQKLLHIVKLRQSPVPSSALELSVLIACKGDYVDRQSHDVSLLSLHLHLHVHVPDKQGQ